MTAAPTSVAKASPTPVAADPTVVKPMPVAAPARMHRRHYLMVISLLAMVVIPVTAVALYMYRVAADQYSSQMAFSVQSENYRNPLEALAGLGTLSTGSVSDTDILYEFIGSQKIVRDISGKLDLPMMFNRASDDPVFRLGDDVSIEDMRDYWKKMVKVSKDKGAGALSVEAFAFSAEDAKAINEAILGESQALVDRLSQVARQDATRYAEADLQEARARLKETRSDLSAFRAESQMIDPTIDLQNQGGVIGALEKKLAEELVAQDVLRASIDGPDSRMDQANRRIQAIRQRIEQEREGLDNEGGGLITKMGRYEALLVEKELAEKAFLSASVAYDAAKAEAKRRSKFLLVHIDPTLADSARYPRRAMIVGLVAILSALIWALSVMVAYSLRDRG